MAYFSTTPHKAVKTIAQNKAVQTPKNSNTKAPSASKPAPLVKGCASCGRKR